MKNYKILFLLLFTFQYVVAQHKTGRLQYAKIETNYGVMIFKLSNNTPKHTANFVKLAKQGYFNQYDFNRVLRGFVAQGGETDSAYAAMEKDGQILERITPELDINLFHQRGALAMGRDDNKDKSSFLGQIYIVDGKKYTDSTLAIAERRIGGGFKFSEAQTKIYKEIGGVAYLDQNYTVFGQLVKGTEVLNQMMNQEADKAGKPKIRIWMKVSILSPKEVVSLKLKRG